MWDILHIDPRSSPLRTRVMDHPSGGCKRSGRVWATHPPDHLWRCVRAWSLEDDEPRACWAVWRIEHPDGVEGWQDTMAGTCYEDAGLMPLQKKVLNSELQFGIRRRGAQRTRWLDQMKPVGDRVSTWMGGCSQGPSILENHCLNDRAMSHRRAVSWVGQQERERETFNCVKLFFFCFGKDSCRVDKKIRVQGIVTCAGAYCVTKFCTRSETRGYQWVSRFGPSRFKSFYKRLAIRQMNERKIITKDRPPLLIGASTVLYLVFVFYFKSLYHFLTLFQGS